MILGIDEAGRGPWAGPLVVGAVVLGGAVIEGLTDSKKLSKKKREALYIEVTSQAFAYASGWVSALELDEYGMSAALRLATRRAVEQITAAYSEIIIDGTINFLADTGKAKYVQTLPKADLLVPSVSAASIIAKVERDNYMTLAGKRYPGYGFERHAGYGVIKHREAIKNLGVTPEHRLSFAPLARYRTVTTEEKPKMDTIPQRISTKVIGDRAETIVAAYLEARGHTIVERNWRTKVCEIDIISCIHDTIYFTEVKYRKNTLFGGGIAAITPKKLRQMTFAARVYTKATRLHDMNLRLAVADVSGVPPVVQEFLELD